ncbi:Peptidoglycan D,D-transpeptidase MrdA [Paenibacillus sp. CECT 9249]|uniref:penicillin-binding transpeptidase domain-containing protein n=1 Tax=Paenibacillus sp. CECT 9249 TaxID=2845385 RepID=UPI001E48B095|nr:penicillin-binding transpeptidase domain-containing protein [Paenibacillus sp. CECT 9249]CAH0118322.1 Peptidoglycan D,D-transpeptidase MrdA [Paenibacillus sp. CECT 9249]
MTNHSMDDQQKREIINRRNFSFRLNLFFFATFVIFSVLIVRLAILQFVEGPGFREMEARIGTKDVKIPPIRGSILDANGERIAYSTSTQSLYFNFDKDYSREVKGVKIYQPEAIELAHRLAEVFDKFGDPNVPKMTADDIVKQMDLDARLNYGYVPRRIKSGLSNEEIAYFMQHKADFPGIDIVEDSIRNYDTDTVAVQLVGYLKKFNAASNPDGGLQKYQDIDNSELPAEEQYISTEDVGYDGLELMFQDELRGKNGLKTFPVNGVGNIVGPMELTKPVKGNDIWMTIDKNVQLKTEQAIMDQIKYLTSVSPSSPDYAPNVKAGYAVAMEVKTGRVVAMASMPDYDPNIWQGGTISSEDYSNIETRMGNGTIREVYQKYATKEEQNKHPSSLVPLGSVIKPLTVLIGLQEKFITPNTRFTDRGSYTIGKKGYERTIKNASGRALGSLTPVTAIQKSSNAFMMAMVGDKLYKERKNGVDLWDQYMEQFGLGVSTGSGLRGEQIGTKEYFHEAKSGSAQSALVYASFGQQGRYTTLQLAQYTTMLANRGKRLKPQFVSKVTDVDGNTVKEFQPEVLGEVDYKDQYWDIIHKGMRSSVQGFEGFPYEYARKSGTSQQSVGGGKIIDNAVFIGFAPADDPVLAVAVVVPEGGYGGRGAAPIARKIFDAYDEAVGLRGVPRKPVTDQTAPPDDDAAGTQSGEQSATNQQSSNRPTSNQAANRQATNKQTTNQSSNQQSTNPDTQGNSGTSAPNGGNQTDGQSGTNPGQSQQQEGGTGERRTNEGETSTPPPNNDPPPDTEQQSETPTDG